MEDSRSGSPAEAALEARRSFTPGDLVESFTGQMGLVLSRADLKRVQSRCKEGKRPGHYFAPGCCANPDYVTQVPVLFEDGTYDVMRAMNLKRRLDLPEEERRRLEKILEACPEG